MAIAVQNIPRINPEKGWITYEKSEVWTKSERLYEVIYESETADSDFAVSEEEKNEEEE